MVNETVNPLTDEVNEAITELKNAYGETKVEAIPDNEGGAFVIVRDLSLGDMYVPSIIWCGFRITHAYPIAQVYPHFVNLELKRKDGKPFGGGFSSPVEWNKLQTIQISRTSRNWNPALDTAHLKLQKVIQWMQQQ